MATIPLEQAVSLKRPQVKRLQVVPLANASTTVAVAAYLVCVGLSIAAPGLLAWFFQTWLHNLSIEVLRPLQAGFQPGLLVAGLLTFGASVWIATAATARLYNIWAR